MTTMALRLAARMSDVALSPTMRGTIEAERLRRSGVDVVDLGAGEPDFPTPAHIVAAARAALDDGFTKYTANTGAAALREAVGSRYRADYGVSYAPDEVVMTAGGKQALFHAAMALFGPGDEVITHLPGWPTLTEQIKLAGAVPVPVVTNAADGFALTAAALLSAVTPRTRSIVINSPTNPTGALLAESEAAALAVEAARRDLWIVLDLCYEQLIYGGVAHNLPRVFGDVMRDRLVICGSVSKSYAMTGWRCGWLAAARPVAAAASALQSHETSNVNSIAQKAAEAALTGPQTCVTEMLAVYARRRDHLLDWLAQEPALETAVPRGAFYLFPSVRRCLRDGTSSTDFASRLLATEHVIVTAGEAFGAPGFLRLSYATSLDRLEEGARRLIRFVRQAARDPS
jgi:aspartate aminotransferase